MSNNRENREYFQVSHIGPDVDEFQQAHSQQNDKKDENDKSHDQGMDRKEYKIIFMLVMVIG